MSSSNLSTKKFLFEADGDDCRVLHLVKMYRISDGEMPSSNWYIYYKGWKEYKSHRTRALTALQSLLDLTGKLYP